MRKTLTDRLVKAKAPGAPVIWDAALTGFGVRVGKTGRTYFIQSRVNGDLFKMKVGRVRMTDKDTAALSLANARKKAGELLAMAQAGDDPRKIAAKAKQAATLAKLNSFANVAAGYMEEHGRFLRSGAELARKLEVDVLPAFGHRPIAEITRGEIKDLFLRKAQTAPVAANRMLALIRLVFNYALDEEMITASPVARIKPRPEASRERCLDAGETAAFWNGLPETGAPLPVQRALKFILTTLQRPGEVLGLRWDEIGRA